MEKALKNRVEEQFKKIAWGSAEILPEDELKSKLAEAIEKEKPLRIKFGVDPTSPDLHLGHAVTLRKLRTFQELGHRVSLLIGDFTARVGDPSGRSSTRPMLTEEQIKKNAWTYTEQAFKIIDREKTDIVYNGDWFAKMNFEDILRLTSKFTVARTLERDDFFNRYQSQVPIYLHEFIYPVMQAYDSVVLKSDVEMGGTDQKFNMLAGRDLQIQYKQKPQVVITMPILEGIDGIQRMSKSTGNYIGLTEPPFEMFGKIMSIPDTLISRYFQLAVGLPEEEVKKIEQDLAGSRVHPGDTKRRLAREIITIYYDVEEAEKAEKDFDIKFKPSIRESMTLEEKLKHIETTETVVGPELFEPGTSTVTAFKLVAASGFAKSNSDAKQKISGGAATINTTSITDPNQIIKVSEGDLLRVGKRYTVLKIRKEK